MSTESVIGMVRRRWGSERPFAGQIAESLARKIASPATRDEVRELARRELQVRQQFELPAGAADDLDRDAPGDGSPDRRDRTRDDGPGRSRGGPGSEPGRHDRSRPAPVRADGPAALRLERAETDCPVEGEPGTPSTAGI